MLVPLLVILWSTLLQLHAAPLQAKYTSCLSEYTSAPGINRLNVTRAYANYVSGTEAAELGLTVAGRRVLRVDLIGNVGSEVRGYDSDTNKLATLFTDTNTAHISVYKSTTWLCNSLFPPDLPQPYYPYNTTYCPLPAGDFGLNLSIPLYRSYALTTLRTQVRLVDTTADAATLACYNLEFTPYREDGWYHKLFLWLPATVAIGFWATTWGARFAAGWVVGSGVAEYEAKEAAKSGHRVLSGQGRKEAKMRKWGTMLVSGLSGERLSVSGGLLRFATPGLRDILQHIQFCTILAMIAVSWPQFAYPILAQGGWADLVWNTTLVQGSDASSDRLSAYPNNYTVPPAFATMMNDPYYPLYLNPTAFNPLLDLHQATRGMPSFAAALGLRDQDLFGTCLVVFLLITAGVMILSVFFWACHGLFEFLVAGKKRNTMPTLNAAQRNSIGSSAQLDLGGKEVYEPRSYGWDTDGQTLPTQASLAAAQQRQSTSGPSRKRRTWLRFRPKGEAGAFHAAALYGNLLRCIVIFHLPITTFSIYQLTLSHASIVSRVFAALAFVVISVLVPSGIMWKIHRTPSGKLYDATRTLLSLGTIYNVYQIEKQMFRICPLVASLVAGIVVGAGQKSGIAQAIILILVELSMLILPALWYPWGEGASMGAPSAFLGMTRVASVVLVMLLSSTLGMAANTNDWIAYAVLVIQAIVFVFFIFMLLTKLIEGLIRLFGGAHFDESTSPLDGGLFAAIMDLDCLNGVMGGKAAARKRRKRGSKQLQRNVSAAGSLTTQMMLDRNSQGVPRQPVSEGTTPFLSTYSSYVDPTTQASHFPGYQPPLGPPPPERHSSESRSEERSAGDHIMDAWRPPSQLPGYRSHPDLYARPGAYVPSAGPSAEATGSNRSFSVIRGGRADYQNPYTVTDGEDAPARALSPPPMIRVSHSPRPSHARQQSSSAEVESYDTGSGPPSPSLGSVPALYPPSHRASRANQQGLRPTPLTIPKRRSLNSLKDEPSPEPSPDSANAIMTKKGKRRSTPSAWFGEREQDSDSPADLEESDDEPGLSRRRRSRQPKPFEPIPSPLGESKGWRAALGMGRKRSLDEMAEMARDENKARKAALAAQSGSMFAGVDSPPTPPNGAKRGFLVNRKGSTQSSGLQPVGLVPLNGDGGKPIEKTFRVKRMAQTRPSPMQISTPSTGSCSPMAPNIVSTQGTNGSDGRTAGKNAPVRSFKVLRPTASPTGFGSGSPKGGSVVVNRLQSHSSPPKEVDTGEQMVTAGYPPSAFVPVNPGRGKRASGGSAVSPGPPDRPLRNPRRTSEENYRSRVGV